MKGTAHVTLVPSTVRSLTFHSPFPVPFSVCRARFLFPSVLHPHPPFASGTDRSCPSVVTSSGPRPAPAAGEWSGEVRMTNDTRNDTRKGTEPAVPRYRRHSGLGSVPFPPTLPTRRNGTVPLLFVHRALPFLTSDTSGVKCERAEREGKDRESPVLLVLRPHFHAPHVPFLFLSLRYAVERRRK